MKLNPIRWLCLTSATAWLTASAAAQTAGSSQDNFLDGLARIVNNSVITVLQVDDAMAPQINTLKQVSTSQDAFMKDVAKLQGDAIEGLTERKLILDDFDKGGYATNVLESAVDDQIKALIKDTYYGERSRLIKTLQAEGMTYEAFRKRQREDFIVRYMNHYNPGIKKMIISPLKVQTYYNDHLDEFKVDDQVKLRMIVIPEPPDSPPGTAKKVAQEVLRKIDSGVPFTEMAAVYSTGSFRAAGGDRGWVTRKDFITALTDAAFSLKPGQHSPVVELPDQQTGASTCYLLQVDEVRPAHVSPLSEVESGIEQTLKDKETKRLVEQWIERLRAKSHIENF